MSNWNFDLAPITSKIGDTFAIEITTRDNAGADVTATGVELRVRKDDGSDDVITKSLADAEVTAEEGLVSLLFTKAMTASLTPGTYIVQTVISTSSWQRTGHGVWTVPRGLP